MKKEKKSNQISLLLNWAGSEKKYLYLAIVFALISGLCTMVPYLGIYQIMVAIFSKTIDAQVVTKTVSLIVLSLVIRFATYGLSGIYSHKGAYKSLYNVRIMVAEHMAKVPLGALNERKSGNLKTILNEDIEKLELFLAHSLPDMVCYLVGPLVIFCYLLTVNAALAIVSLVPMVLAVAVMGIMFRNTDELMERGNASIINLNSVMIEYINGMRLIKAYNLGSSSFNKFSNAVKEENNIWNEMSRRMGPPFACFIVLIECGMLFMVPLGGFFFLNGSISESVFLLFVFVGSLYLTEIRPLQELGSTMANVIHAIDKVNDFLNIPVVTSTGKFPTQYDIELRNVCFSYDGKVNVLENCNLKVEDGQRVALIGASGSGKTTIIELISRFYDVQKGEVLIGGKNVKDISYEQILNNISIVFQKTFLSRDTVLENIRMGKNASLEEVRAAAKLAQIDDFIMSLPDQYNTQVGNFMNRFSGGEKQRIAIARAILKNAPILILDEATSASDPESQVLIDLAIENLCQNRTVIVVAHRLSALKMCHRIGVVENHCVSALASHDELFAKNEYYHESYIKYEKSRNIFYQLPGGESYAKESI